MVKSERKLQYRRSRNRSCNFEFKEGQSFLIKVVPKKNMNQIVIAKGFLFKNKVQLPLASSNFSLLISWPNL